MRKKRHLWIVWAACVALVAAAGPAGVAAATLPGCASGEAPGTVVLTVGVSAAGTPFVTSYVASAPTPSGNVGCTAPPAASAGATFIVNGPGVSLYPATPVSVSAVTPGGAGVPIPTTVNLLQVGSYLLAVPANPLIQLYQIAPGFYVVRSLDPSQNTTIVLPLPGVPAAPNTGPIPSVIH